jgi:hypothetical protein
MKFLILFLSIISIGYSQKAIVYGASISYSNNPNRILLYTPVSLFETTDNDYHVRVRLRREAPIGVINGVEYGYLIEQSFFEYDGYKLPMFWAFSTLYSVKYKTKKNVSVSTLFEIFYTKPGNYYMKIDKMCYDDVMESSEVSITIK